LVEKFFPIAIALSVESEFLVAFKIGIHDSAVKITIRILALDFLLLSLSLFFALACA